MVKPKNNYINVGKATDEVNVEISHRIIQLFSEGLYSSPNKAVEELVSNAFDANARNVHVVLSPDLHDDDATIVVIDDGEGMDIDQLKNHWIIGYSPRRDSNVSDNRKPIGKFGIGKLATFVLAERLTHICKSGNKYYAVTMDYSILDKGIDNTESAGKGVFNEETMKLPIRELTEHEARAVLSPWISSKKAGYKALRLFDEEATKSWTVAIMSNLKEMGRMVKRGRLEWILRTAMPLRDDFKLYFDGKRIKPGKIDRPLISKWIIGKDITEIGDTGLEGFSVTIDELVPKHSVHRYGLSHNLLGRVTGYVELYEDELTSSDIGRSNGFFIYVRERMVNTEDPGFGIERNLLRHGTFNRLRVIVHIDSLDSELQSHRESLKQSQLYKTTTVFLRSLFNLARNKLVEYEKQTTPGAIISTRISSAPSSITRAPLIALIKDAIEGKITPIYTSVPSGLSPNQKSSYLEKIYKRIDSGEGLLSKSEVVLLSGSDGIAVYDAESGKLQVNLSHPFVSTFQDDFIRAKTSLPLEMFTISEVLMEARLYYIGLSEGHVQDIMNVRDELLRQLVRSSGRRNARMISIALQDAKDDENKLEEELTASFEALGFDNVLYLGKSGRPDGTAEAYLSATEDSVKRSYKVALEAKSSPKVSAKELNVSGLKRHMGKFGCDHHFVVGNAFATSKGDESATVQEIKEIREKDGFTITLMHIDDLARLVRLVPPKRIGLRKLRELFLNNITPEESKLWVDEIAKIKQSDFQYREILTAIWDLSKIRMEEAVEYQAVCVELQHREPPVIISKSDLIGCCKAMQFMANGVVFAHENTVEIERRPDLILEDIQTTIDDYPDEERETIII
jgi:hypothetical protein